MEWNYWNIYCELKTVIEHVLIVTMRPCVYTDRHIQKSDYEEFSLAILFSSSYTSSSWDGVRFNDLNNQFKKILIAVSHTRTLYVHIHTQYIL